MPYLIESGPKKRAPRKRKPADKENNSVNEERATEPTVPAPAKRPSLQERQDAFLVHLQVTCFT